MVDDEDELRDGVGRFDDAAATYHEARPGWPAAAVRALADRLELPPAARAVDLAAGTGKLTAPLAAAFADVVAVEPSAAMRAELVRHHPGVRTLDGRAEALPLPAAGAEVVAVGEAFHWFATPVAVAEMARVLRPGGGVALLWNRVGDGHGSGWGPLAEIVAPVTEHPLAQRQARGIEARKGSGADGWRAAFAGSGFAAPVLDVVPNPELLDPGRLVALVASWSWVAVLPPGERSRVLADVGARARAHGPLEIPYEAHVWTARLTRG